MVRIKEGILVTIRQIILQFDLYIDIVDIRCKDPLFFHFKVGVRSYRKAEIPKEAQQTNHHSKKWLYI